MILDAQTARRVHAVLTADLGGAQLTAEYDLGWSVPTPEGHRHVRVRWLRDGAVGAPPYAITVTSAPPDELPCVEHYALLLGFQGAYGLRQRA